MSLHLPRDISLDKAQAFHFAIYYFRMSLLGSSNCRDPATCLLTTTGHSINEASYINVRQWHCLICIPLYIKLCNLTSSKESLECLHAFLGRHIPRC